MKDNTRVKVWVDPCMMGMSIALVERRGDKWFIARPVALQYEEVKPNGAVEPTFRLTHESGEQLIEELQNIGVKTETDAKRDGKLEATERHLADLRQMLKLK